MKHKHLLGLEDYPAEDIQTIIDTAFSFREVLERPIKKVPSLQGKTIVNLFFENSTRMESVCWPIEGTARILSSSPIIWAGGAITFISPCTVLVLISLSAG